MLQTPVMSFYIRSYRQLIHSKDPRRPERGVCKNSSYREDRCISQKTNSCSDALTQRGEKLGFEGLVTSRITCINVIPPYPLDIAFSDYILVSGWHAIVRNYSSRSIKFGKDIFPVIRGIVSQLQQKYACKYVAGILESKLASGLLWQRIGDNLAGPS
jgi:hypothetical protein